MFLIGILTIRALSSGKNETKVFFEFQLLSALVILYSTWLHIGAGHIQSFILPLIHSFLELRCFPPFLKCLTV